MRKVSIIDLNNLFLICLFIHLKFVKHLQVPGDKDSKANTKEYVVALWASGRAESESPGSQSSSVCCLFLSCYPSWKPHHRSKHASLAFSEAKHQAGWMFHVSQDVVYVLHCIFLFLLLNSWIMLIKAKYCSKNIL